MQDQLPLRLSEFLKVRDGFIAYLRKPAGTSLNAIIPDEVIVRMKEAAIEGARKRQPFAWIKIASSVCLALSVTIAVIVEPMALGLICMAASGIGFVWSSLRAARRSEPEIELLTDDPAVAATLRALDSYKARIAQGQIHGQERFPGGSIRKLPKAVRRAFLADHSSLLVVSNDPDLWKVIPRRPLPASSIWVRVGDQADPSTTSAVSLRNIKDDALFDKRTKWLFAKADHDTRDARAFRHALQLIIAFRRHDLAGLTFEQKKEKLAKEDFSISMIEKMHAGVYEPFNRFLKTLPLHEMP